MVITDYRVRSVLRTYSRQLQRSRLSAELTHDAGEPRSTVEKVTISDDARRHLVMERMTSQVLEKAYPRK
ncbi:MAG: hypothetical protein GX443_12590 [Deltaproteobacteria bacterium]|nr:hypothetical protein [Deltaproteobacteria bacterium]